MPRVVHELHRTKDPFHARAGRRSDHGVDVTLFWHPDTDELTVCVWDQRRGAYCEVAPAANDPLDAFYHPYSYATLSCVHAEDDRLAA